MKKSAIMAVAATVFLSACVTDGDGVITHTDYEISARDRAIVRNTIASQLGVTGVQFQGLEASESLSNGAVTLCGYVSAISPAGTRSPNAVFGGMFSADRTQFMLFGGGGKGQDASRIQQVRTMCGVAGIYL